MKERIARNFDIFANKLVQFSQTKGYKTWLIFLFILAVAIAIMFPFSGYSQPVGMNHPSVCKSEIDHELRGVWLTNIDSEVLFSQSATKDAIASLAELNFNTLYPTVWNWGYTLYPSEVAASVTGEALDPTEGLQERDVLAEIISAGHEAGMGVIPWFEFGFMAPADSELARRHPEWLTQRQDASTIWWEGKVHQRVWLNPLHPEVQQFITALIVEVVSNYDLDGIQMDDHFGYPSEFGYDQLTVKLYQQEHEGQSPPKDTQDSEWVRWRADKITAYVETLFHAIKQANPNAIVSVSPNPQEFSLNSFLLDWYKWERMGLIEELIVQVYRDRYDSFIRELEQPEIIAASQHIPVAVGILSGLKGRPVLWHNIEQQVQATRDRNLAGVSFFFYESLWNLAQELPQRRQAALKYLFKDSVSRPHVSDCHFNDQ
ncbi:MAG: glycoside hydrolase family 10 protein [Pleurocapsa sp.]